VAAPVANDSVTPEVFRERIAGTFPGNLGIEVVRIEDEEVEGRLAADVLSAIAQPLHVGRRTQVWNVRISNGERDAAFFTCTQMVLEPRH
jgi:acyl-coenzyme A thioesterase PaaI-like protein